MPQADAVPASGRPIRPRPFVLGLVIVAFGAGLWKVERQPSSPEFQPGTIADPQAAPGLAPRLQTRFVTTTPGLHRHAACLVELGDGRVRAFWYSGSREGAPDVEIRTAVFDDARGVWDQEAPVADPDRTQRSLRRYVRKVGNPAAIRTPDGILWLFYVTVTAGGWGGSSVTALTSTDDGKSWGQARRLVSTPFFNLGTLVRGQPLLYTDGTIGLPVYEQLLGAVVEVLRVDESGSVVDRRRLSSGGSGLQPVVLVRSAREALALLRSSGPERTQRVIATTTRDSGRHWAPPAPLSLRNPDAALSGIVLPDGRILVALNDVEGERDRLSLVVSEDGGVTWRTVYVLEDEVAARGQPVDDARYDRTVEALARDSDARVADGRPYVESARRFMCWEPRCHFEFSYPFLVQTRRGDFHLVYTWNRCFIKHVELSRAWLDARLAGLSHARPD